MANILIIDDDKSICTALAKVMERMDHEVVYALTLKEGIYEVSSLAFDVVFLDVRLPDGNGLDALPKIKEISSPPEVIIITGEGDPDGAELAIKSDAWDYIEKPLSFEAITLPLKRALEYRKAKKTKKSLTAFKREGIIGNSKKIKNCFELVARAAESDTTVLITGETGTGKELFAGAIHDNSVRKQKNFVIVDCAALPETLVESTLFGHKKGAFTGADRDYEGLLKQADGGTLFLDEIGELPLSVQKTFLRVLQEHRFRPVGDVKEVKSDFRLIVATNRNLGQMVQKGKFRQDLLYRIQSIVIELPPLKQRKEDIGELAIYFMNKLCISKGIATKGFSPEFIESLTSYAWPGNVREMENCMKSIFSEADDDPILYPWHFPMHIRTQLARMSVRKKASISISPAPIEIPSSVPEKFKDFREMALSEAGKRYLQNLMSHTQGNIKEACRISDLSRSRLYALLKKHDISRER